jgi:hypothetical protein
MRFAPFFALLAGVSILAAGTYEAGAQTRDQRPRVIIKKRSYLDAGTEVKQDSKNYHSHIYDRNSRYSTIGPNVQGDARWPLPDQFYLPNY